MGQPSATAVPGVYQMVPGSTDYGVLLGEPGLTPASLKGFPHIPSVAGRPTGSPLAAPGYEPICWDSVNQVLWVGNGVIWIPVGTAAPGTNQPAGWNNAWLIAQAKAVAQTGNARLTVIGGSTMEGVASSNFTTKAAVSLLMNQLVARGLPLQALCFLPNAASAWPQPAWQGTVQWVLNQAPTSIQLGGLAMYPEYNSGATLPMLSFAPSTPVVALDAIYYDGGPNNATWSWRVDSGTARTVTLTNSGSYKRLSNEANASDLTNLTSGTHHIAFGNPSQSSSMRIIAGIAYVQPSTSYGLQIARCANGGMGIARNFGGNGSNGVGAVIPADGCLQWQGATDGSSSTVSGGWPWSADLYIIDIAGDMIGATEVDPQTSERVLERIIKACRRGSPGCSILLWGPCISGDYSDSATGAFNFQSYLLWRRGVTDLISAYQCAYLDMTNRWSCNGATNGFQPSNSTDPTDAGHADMAAAMGTLI